MLKSYRELLVWQKSYALALELYSATSDFPKHEIYGLTSQMRRASVSIPSNIAEGYARGYRPEYIRFTGVAYGSLAELQTQLMLARDLDYLNPKQYDELASGYEELERMLSALIRALKNK